MNTLFSEDSINEFQGEYRFLSNFWPAKIVVGQKVFNSAEHLYQSEKLWYSELRNGRLIELKELMEKFASDDLTNGQAKRLGAKIPIVKSLWDEAKVDVMTRVVELKFDQNKLLAEKLVNTGESYIQEGNTWGDTFWGVDLKTGNGKNMLGQIIMNYRERINKTHSINK